ncbi:MAG: ABC transporter ATP-binding protein [Candidatus Bipolaricaulota bacterium]|nr:MAG: ABC transporter ATP-binding protein [Candidatus Bipolaricaulota bacterium]
MSLEVRGVSFAYRGGRPLLHRADLSVDDGRQMYILGANGSGKSTLLRLIAGVLSPWTGEILIDDVAAQSLGPRGRAHRLAMVPQGDVPLTGYKVAEVVVMGRASQLAFFSHPAKKDWGAVRDALADVGIAELAERRYDAISGGERQLALIARGLAQGARNLLLDEPDAHLDPAYQHRVLTTLTALARGGLALVVTSHHPNNALLFGDEVTFLIAGKTTPSRSPEAALNDDWLQAAYGIAFEGVRSGGSLRALLPRRDSGR